MNPFVPLLAGLRALQRLARNYAVLILSALVVSGLLSRAEVLLQCTDMSGNESYSRGFYLPDYPGNSLDSVDLTFVQPGWADTSYTVTLTARSKGYDGPVLGTSTQTFRLPGLLAPMRMVTFPFPSTRIVKGSRVCFSLSVRSGPASQLNYLVSGGCSEIIRTVGTEPPLDRFLGYGVLLSLRGEDTLIVSPGETIQAAIDAASAGDTVVVEPGVYEEDIRLKTGVKVIGAGCRSTTLKGVSGRVVAATDVTDAQLQGFKITNGKYAAGVWVHGGNLLLNDNWITDNDYGVYIEGGSSAIVRNNLIENNGSKTTSGRAGIRCYSASPLICNNVVAANLGHGVALYWDGSSGAQVINNTIVDNRQYGVYCASTAKPVIKNNIIRGNSTGIAADSTPQISFNNLWGNSVNYGAGLAPGVGDISADPLFLATSAHPWALTEGSPCIDAGDPDPLYNDLDGSRNDLGAYGGPSGLPRGSLVQVTTGFLFTSVGKIPTSEILRSGAQAGLANVSTAVASALQIEAHKDAPFGGAPWIQGLFGTSDVKVRYYRIFAAKWNGATPPAETDFKPVDDPLSKIEYTVSASGKVTATLEKIGPDARGLYLRTDSGYWAHSDLLLILNSRRLENCRYDFICKGYDAAGTEVLLPGNDLSRLVMHIDNQPVTARIESVRDSEGRVLQPCDIVRMNVATNNLRFEISAQHPAGFLDGYTLEAFYGRNQYAGVIAHDQYVGSHDTSPPQWLGVVSALADSATAGLSWQTCAYEFRLGAVARTIDGFSRLHSSCFRDHYYVLVGSPDPTGRSADLDVDGDVDGDDLAIFAAQYGRTSGGE